MPLRNPSPAAALETAPATPSSLPRHFSATQSLSASNHTSSSSLTFLKCRENELLERKHWHGFERWERGTAFPPMMSNVGAEVAITRVHIFSLFQPNSFRMEENSDESFSILSKQTMSIPRNSIRSFLAKAKATVRNAAERGAKATFVIGNESAGTSTSESVL